MTRTTPDAFKHIHRVIKHGDRIGLRGWLSSGGNANLRNRFGWSLLMLAALHGRTDLAEDLIGAGALPGVANAFGDTALSLARLKGFARTARVIERATVDDTVAVSTTGDGLDGQREHQP